MISTKVPVLKETRYSEFSKRFHFFLKSIQLLAYEKENVVEQSGTAGVPARERGKGLEWCFV